MSVTPKKEDRDLAAPFLVRLFYRTGAFHRPEEFTSHHLPPHASIYAWPTCTLKELALDLAASEPSALPFPAIGTRLAFQLVCPDLRSTSAVSNAQPQFAVKDLGSVVIGEGGPGVDGTNDDVAGPRGGVRDSEKTLSDARFVVGDYVSCAVLPPQDDGSVAPPSSARRDPAGGLREGRGGRGGYRGRSMNKENGFGRGGDRGGPSGRRDNGEAGFPMGEWRRGERLPDGPSRRSRGRGRW